MKLIIDISEKEYKRIMRGNWIGEEMAEIFENGVPLDDIKAEIDSYMILQGINAQIINEIIDRHTKGAE